MHLPALVNTGKLTPEALLLLIDLAKGLYWKHTKGKVPCGGKGVVQGEVRGE